MVNHVYNSSILPYTGGLGYARTKISAHRRTSSVMSNLQSDQSPYERIHMSSRLSDTNSKNQSTSPSTPQKNPKDMIDVFNINSGSESNLT